MPNKRRLSRRDFLKLSGTGLLSLFLSGFRGMSFELFDSDETIEGILNSNNLLVYNLSLTPDFTYDYEKPIKNLRLNEVISGYKGKYILRTGNMALTATVLNHVTGESALPIAILDVGRIKYEELYQPNTRFFIEDTTTLSEYTYSAEVYPNKIKNLIKATIALLQFQEREEGFYPRKRYSLLDIFDIEHRRYYPGFTTTGAVYGAGGICSAASLVAKSLLKLYSYSPGISFLEQWGHFPEENRDVIGPGDSRITYENSDVAIDIFDGGHDFCWVFPRQHEKYYLSPSVSVFPNGKPIAASSGLEGQDAWIFLTYTWVTEPQISKIEYLRDLLMAYDNYRANNEISSLLRQGTVRNIEWGTESIGEGIFNLVYPNK